MPDLRSFSAITAPMLPMPMRPIASSFAIPVALLARPAVASADALISCRIDTDRYGLKASSTQTQYRVVWDRAASNAGQPDRVGWPNGWIGPSQSGAERLPYQPERIRSPAIK